jgi:hypothetical protein
MSIYNAFDHQRLHYAVQSLRAQERVEMEIVVAESNPNPCFKNSAKDLGVRYKFEASSEISNPGRVRNLALAMATGDLIYSTDADILFPPRFMSELLALPRQVWIHPPKRRLPKDQFLRFHARAHEQGLESALADMRSDPYFASLAEPIQYKLSEKEGLHYTCILSDYARWRSTPEMRQRAPAFWDSTCHRGGTLASRFLWHEVGGYAEVYHTWGYEDVDVQWKLQEKSPIGQIPNEERFRTLHLDHDKTYFSPEHNAANQQRFQERKASPAHAIAYDQLRFKALKS